MLTQLMHRWDGERVRRYLLLRPFGPAVELEDLEDLEDTTTLPPYNAAADLAPRTPQMLQRDLGRDDRSLPWITPPLATDCDRSGACCSQYPVVATTLAERERAVATLGPDAWPLPYPASAAFGPAFPGHREPLNPVFIGDGCGFLGPQGCRIHAAGGAQAKPLTCRAFPWQIIHCGDHLEMSILPQCACAARCTTPGTSDDWPRDHLDRLRSVPEIPDRIVVDPQRLLPKDAYLQWVRALADVMLAPTGESPLTHLRRALDSLHLPAANLSETWLETLEERALDEADRFETFLDPTSPQPAGLRWVADLAGGALQSLLDGELPEDPTEGHRESDASVLALALRAHVLLELPTLQATLTDVCRIAWLASLSREVGCDQDLDARLEPLTLMLYLWATTKWPVSAEVG